MLQVRAYPTFCSRPWEKNKAKKSWQNNFKTDKVLVDESVNESLTVSQTKAQRLKRNPALEGKYSTGSDELRPSPVPSTWFASISCSLRCTKSHQWYFCGLFLDSNSQLVEPNHEMTQSQEKTLCIQILGSDLKDKSWSCMKQICVLCLCPAPS